MTILEVGITKLLVYVTKMYKIQNQDLNMFFADLSAKKKKKGGGVSVKEDNLINSADYFKINSKISEIWTQIKLFNCSIKLKMDNLNAEIDFAVCKFWMF